MTYAITKTDKGGAVIVMNTELYRLLNIQMPSDDKTYIPLPLEPTTNLLKLLKNLLSQGVSHGIFTQNLADRLYKDHPVIQIFTSIVAGIGSLGEPLGMWLDSLL